MWYIRSWSSDVASHVPLFTRVHFHLSTSIPRSKSWIFSSELLMLGVFGSWLFFWWGPNLSCSTWFLTIVSCSTTMKNNHLGEYFLPLPSILSKRKKCTFSFVGDMLMDSGINKWIFYNARSMTHVFCRFTCYFSFSWMIMNDMESVLHIGTSLPSILPDSSREKTYVNVDPLKVPTRAGSTWHHEKMM